MLFLPSHLHTTQPAALSYVSVARTLAGEAAARGPTIKGLAWDSCRTFGAADPDALVYQTAHLDSTLDALSSPRPPTTTESDCALG